MRCTNSVLIYGCPWQRAYRNQLRAKSGLLRASSRLAQDIDKLCTECASLIDNHDKIRDLSAVHYNLGKTLQDVENIVALPQQAAEAEDMLKDDTQLSEAR